MRSRAETATSHRPAVLRSAWDGPRLTRAMQHNAALQEKAQRKDCNKQALHWKATNISRIFSHLGHPSAKDILWRNAYSVSLLLSLSFTAGNMFRKTPCSKESWKGDMLSSSLLKHKIHHAHCAMAKQEEHPNPASYHITHHNTWTLGTVCRIRNFRGLARIKSVSILLHISRFVSWVWRISHNWDPRCYSNRCPPSCHAH